MYRITRYEIKQTDTLSNNEVYQQFNCHASDSLKNISNNKHFVANLNLKDVYY